MSERSSLAITLTVVAGILAYKFHKDRQKPPLVLPPSPKSYPLIGHLLSIPQEFEHLGFMKICEQLGSEIISLSAFGTTLVVLNDKDDAINLLEKRSAIYSDRTVPTMAAEASLLDWGAFASLVRYGERWRAYRRLMNPWLHKQAATAFHGSQEHEAQLLLQRLLNKCNELDSSEELEAELSFTVASTLLRSIYGYEAKSIHDRYLVGAREMFAYLSKAVLPSNYLVNTIPALVHVPDWFPGTRWKKEAKEWRQTKEALLRDTYKLALDHIARGGNQYIMATALKNKALELGLSEDLADEYVQEIAIAFFAGGTDTTVNTLMMFFIAMILFPDVQKKAQEELDRVIGTTRFPNVADRDQLDYVGRVVQEVFRWGPVTPIAFPHTAFEDDKYKGYDIPKGAIVIGNVWAMTRNPKVYKDPETFDPDRFLDPSTPPSPLFGWGRRRCPGVHFAEASVFIVIATVLMGFHIGPAQDEHGNDIRPTQEKVNATILCPKPFKLKLTPRSGRHEELIRNVLG